MTDRSHPLDGAYDPPPPPALVRPPFAPALRPRRKSWRAAVEAGEISPSLDVGHDASLRTCSDASDVAAGDVSCEYSGHESSSRAADDVSCGAGAHEWEQIAPGARRCARCRLRDADARSAGPCAGSPSDACWPPPDPADRADGVAVPTPNLDKVRAMLAAASRGART